MPSPDGPYAALATTALSRSLLADPAQRRGDRVDRGRPGTTSGRATPPSRPRPSPGPATSPTRSRDLALPAGGAGAGRQLPGALPGRRLRAAGRPRRPGGRSRLGAVERRRGHRSGAGPPAGPAIASSAAATWCSARCTGCSTARPGRARCRPEQRLLGGRRDPADPRHRGPDAGRSAVRQPPGAGRPTRTQAALAGPASRRRLRASIEQDFGTSGYSRYAGRPRPGRRRHLHPPAVRRCSAVRRGGGGPQRRSRRCCSRAEASPGRDLAAPRPGLLDAGVRTLPARRRRHRRPGRRGVLAVLVRPALRRRHDPGEGDRQRPGRRGRSPGLDRRARPALPGPSST